MLDEPRIAQLRRIFETRSARAAERTEGLREAAVALIVRPRDHLEVLLIRRAELVGDPWSGHVALPGGRRDPGDHDLLATAMRESEEEVGIPLQRTGTFVGALDEVAPSSSRLLPIVIAPFVLAVPPDTSATPSPREVQAALWVPIDALRETDAMSEINIEMREGVQAFPSLVYADYVIWGLTYRILQQFLSVTDQTVSDGD